MKPIAFLGGTLPALFFWALEPTEGPVHEMPEEPRGWVSANATPRSSGCLSCHEGIEDMHPWDPVTCVECHGGNDQVTTKERAHVRRRSRRPNDERVLPLDFDLAWTRFVNPSDLRVVDETCGLCHAGVVSRVKKSLHATTAGHLCDGLYENGVLSKKSSPYGVFGVKDEDGVASEHGVSSLKPIPGLRGSDKDSIGTHFTDLARKSCMRCHLWSEGQAVEGRLGQDGDYRGSGCAACHVTYADNGLSRTGDPSIDRFEPGHPVTHTMTTAPPTQTCVRCHYGDASIGMHFRGLAQTVPGMPAGPDIPNTTDTPLYGAFFIQDPVLTPPDIHHERGMHCVDCHTGRDLMGDGDIYEAMEHAIEIECSDCHGSFQRPSNLQTSRNHPLSHLKRVGKDVILTSRVTGREHVVPQVVDILDPKHPRYNAEAAKAMTAFHGDLECYACHTSWNVNFFGFHFDRNLSFTQLDMISGKRTDGRVTTQEKVFATLKEFRLGWNSEGKIAPYMVGFSSMGSVHGDDGETRLRQELPGTSGGLSGMTMIHHQVHSIRPAARSCIECHRSATTWGVGSPNHRLARDIVFSAGTEGLQVLALDPKNPLNALPLATLPLPPLRDVLPVIDPIQGHAHLLYATASPIYSAEARPQRLTSGGLFVIDVADPLAPRALEFLEAFDPQELVSAGRYLLLADGEAGLKVFDTRGKLELVGQVLTANARGVALNWPYAFVADGPGGLLVVNLERPKNPTIVAALELDRGRVKLADAQGVAVMYQYSRPDPMNRARSPSRLLVAVAAGRGGIYLVDGTESTRPRVIYGVGYEARREGGGRRSTSRDRNFVATDVVLGSRFDLGDAQGEIPTVENDYAYVLYRRGSGARGYVSAMRVTDPTRPSRVDSVNLGVNGVTDLESVHVYNPPFLVDYVFAAGREGTAVVDVSKSEDLEIKGNMAFTQGSQGVAVEEFPLDRMITEQAESLKDISHPGSRYVSRGEMDRILSVPAFMLGTDRVIANHQSKKIDPPRFGAMQRSVLDKLDRDDDGVLSGKELEGSNRSYASLDADGDGAVTLRELLGSDGQGRSVTSNPMQADDSRMENGEPLESLRTRTAWTRILSGIDPRPYDRNEDRMLAIQTELRELIFRIFDRDGSGRLEEDELGQIPGFDPVPRRGARRKGQGPLSMDRNRNRKLSMQELRMDSIGVEYLDLNADGQIDLREYPAAIPATNPEPMYLDVDVLVRKFDRNRDGKLDRREFPQGFGTGGRGSLDEDGNDRLEDRELLRLVALSRDRGLRGRSGDGFARFDLDGDGRVDEKEFPGPAWLFRRLDVDRDGVLQPRPGRR